MTDFLSKISGQISGSMIVGSFFPTLLFVVVLALVVLPLTPAPFAQDLAGVVNSGKTWDEKGVATLIVALAALVLTIVVYAMNRSVLGLYEGYPWRDSAIGNYLSGRQRRRFDKLVRIRDRARKLRREIRLSNLPPGVAQKTIEVQRKVSRTLNDHFPDDPSLVLPTRLGNVMRAVETYTRRQYGAPMNALWPRLRNVLESDRALAVDNIKAVFDFMLNLSFLSGLLALALTAVALYWRAAAKAFIWWDAALIAAAWLSYEAAIVRATAWGGQMKACFDLYRRPLLDKLGYADCKPADLTEERRVWKVIDYKLSFPDEPASDIPYKTSPVSLIVEPVTATVTVAQTVAPADDKTVTVTAEIANTGPLSIPADRVTLREEVPSGQWYVPGSATVNGEPAVLLSVNPLQIDLGPLAYYESRTVVFKWKAQA